MLVLTTGRHVADGDEHGRSFGIFQRAQSALGCVVARHDRQQQRFLRSLLRLSPEVFLWCLFVDMVPCARLTAATPSLSITVDTQPDYQRWRHDAADGAPYAGDKINKNHGELFRVVPAEGKRRKYRHSDCEKHCARDPHKC